MATAICAVVFTGCLALSVIVSFAFQAYNMWKTKNFRFLHKDIFSLFFAGALLFSIALVAGQTSILNGFSGSLWACNPVRWTWVGFSIFISIVCLGMLAFATMNNGKKLGSQTSDGVSDLHSYSVDEEEEESFEPVAEILGGDLSSNLQGNI